MLSTGQIVIQGISVNKTNLAIRWIVIYPVHNVLNNLYKGYRIPERTFNRVSRPSDVARGFKL